MKEFALKSYILASVLLAVFTGCTREGLDERCGEALRQPEVSVRGLSSTGFMLVWDAVENAGSYTYVFNGGEAVTTDDRVLSFSGLENHTEYVVSLRADAAEGSPYVSSDYTYVHVFTDDILPLDTPEPVLGCAYASKTIISWPMVGGASGYEYAIDGKTAVTPETQVVISGLEMGTEYTFSVKAISADPQDSSDSESAVLRFTTSDEDIPQYLIVPVSVVADAVSFDVYAEAGALYFYDVIPGYLLSRYSDRDLMETYRTAILQYAREQGISLSLALASVLASGTGSFTVSGLVSEMTYAIIAFGMDTKGEITSSLYRSSVKTTATGASDGPSFGGGDWFSQRFYLDNSISAISGEDWTTSAVTSWSGQNVEEMRYRVLPTSDFNTLFSDEPDPEAVKAFLRTENYAYVASDAILASLNSVGVTMLSSGLRPGTSYTLSSLAVSGGDEILSVNSLTTKTDPEARTWFTASALVSETYGETWNSAVGVMRGTEVVSLRYMMIASSAIEGVPESSYPDLLENYGSEGGTEHLDAVNGGGLAIRFVGLSPRTGYTFIAMAGNPTGDTLLRYASVTTSAAPGVDASAMPSGTRSGIVPERGEAIEIDFADKSISPVRHTVVPAGGSAGTGDLWTIIHNMKILENE